MNKKELKILYLVNFYGTPPLNYFEKLIKENKKADLTIFKLPSVRPMKHRFLLDALLIENNGRRKDLKASLWFPLPLFCVFAFQYFVNFFVLFMLLAKSENKKFDIAFGETSFGGAMIYTLKFLRIAKFTVYMNGDVLPDTKNKKTAFYFRSNSYWVNKIDTVFIKFQHLLRKLGFKNDVIWYPSKKVEKWDLTHGYKAKDIVRALAVTLDHLEVEANLKVKKKENTLGYIGRLDESAGVDIALKSLVLIKEEIPDIELLVVGGGSLVVEKYKKND